jgi:hypothetical protein
MESRKAISIMRRQSYKRMESRKTISISLRNLQIKLKETLDARTVTNN